MILPSPKVPTHGYFRWTIQAVLGYRINTT
jgi:hypothetical protein